MSIDDVNAAGLPRGITPAQRVDALREVNRGSPFAFIWEWMRVFTLSVGLFLVIRTFLVEAFKIPSGSMEGKARSPRETSPPWPVSKANAPAVPPRRKPGLRFSL